MSILGNQCEILGKTQYYDAKQQAIAMACVGRKIRGYKTKKIDCYHHFFERGSSNLWWEEGTAIRLYAYG